jgi:uncharacterized protein with PQ loop repeat
MKTLINVVGILGSVGIAASLFPQTYKTIKTNDMQSISKHFILITLFSSLLQLTYAIYYLIIPMLIANICVSINTLILFLFIVFPQ